MLFLRTPLRLLLSVLFFAQRNKIQNPYSSNNFFAFIQISITLVLCLAAWYRFFRSIIAVLLSLLLSGFLAGAIYTNVLKSLGEGKGRVQEFCRALSSSMLSLPILIAGLLGLPTEIILRERCFQIETNVVYCFTRAVLH